ncbi:MAG: efflux RND transporter periplasmic adaptor subunit [Betaproteobacteria bacterium]|nr:MAG: efflux RND transporter periplasmic adaptor subunit [Betaproteobacteria bacterium]
MNRLAWILVVVVAAAGLAGGYWAGTRKAEQASAPQAAAGATSTAGGKILYYRNPMGLPDTSPVPKKDPMGMDYVPVYQGEAPAPQAPGTVKISPDKMQLLGVRTELAQVRDLRRVVQAVGTIQPNERQLFKVAPRFEGWIEKLYVNTTGQAIGRGQPLMEVYSPELVTAQEEYLIALRGMKEAAAGGADAQAVMQRLADSALRRLRNWEISDEELRTLQRDGKPRQHLAFRSPVNGVVLQKPSVQGMRFMPGDVLFEVADLSSVWMLAEVFEQDLRYARVGQEVDVRVASYPDMALKGKVVFVYPTIDPATRTARVRVELANKGGLLKPAMYGSVEFVAAHPRGKVLAVPDSAVLDSGKRQAVLVRRGEAVFEPRTVKLGMRAEGYSEVTEGLKAGDEVVVRANFLIDAESNLKSALESFGSQPKAAAAHRASGTIQAVDAQGGTVEIEHGPIPTLQWPAMTMEFAAKDKALLAGLKPGQAVEFELTQGKPGEYVIERITASSSAHKGH